MIKLLKAIFILYTLFLFGCPDRQQCPPLAGNGITDDTDAIQCLLDANKTVCFDKRKRFYITKTLVIRHSDAVIQNGNFIADRDLLFFTYGDSVKHATFISCGIDFKKPWP